MLYIPRIDSSTIMTRNTKTMTDTNLPETVELTLEPRDIPDERVEVWTDAWESMNALEQSKHEAESVEEYVELQAREWVRETFLNAQGHNDAHRWIDSCDVRHDVNGPFETVSEDAAVYDFDESAIRPIHAPSKAKSQFADERGVEYSNCRAKTIRLNSEMYVIVGVVDDE